MPDSQSPDTPAYARLESRFQRLNALGEAQEVLHWDMSTVMPRGGHESRAEQLAELAAVYHGMLTDSETGDLIAAAEAAEALAAEGMAVAVVSMPSWELFEAQDADYRALTLGTAPRIAVEAAGKFGWTRYVATEDDVIGMTGFGASAPIDRLYQEFGITPEAIIARARLVTGH